jgi:hypothetical protein
VSEQQEDLKDYRQGDTVRLTVEMRDSNGVRSAFARTFLEGRRDDDPEQVLDLSGWAEGEPGHGWGEGEPVQAEVVLSGTVEQQRPGVYACFAIVPQNAYGAMSRHELDPPLRFRIVEHPDDVRQGPEVLSVGTFW